MAEMLSLTQQFLVAGNETTTNAVAAGVQLLIEHPEQQQDLQQDRREGRLRTFANEVLRLESPVQGLFRVVRRNVTLAGVELPAGSRVMVRFAAANRDPAQYQDPDLLDLQRDNAGTHLAFGAGIHHCIGANLSREELIQTFDVLLARCGNLSFADSSASFADGSAELEHHPSMILRGLKRLPIRLDRR
jgi:cytochrome P450